MPERLSVMIDQGLYWDAQNCGLDAVGIMEEALRARVRAKLAECDHLEVRANFKTDHHACTKCGKEFRLWWDPDYDRTHRA